MQTSHGKRNWRLGLAFAGFLAIAGFFLLTEHRAHVFGALPFVLLALCALLHFFGHGGQDHDHNHDHGKGYKT